jgi:hypothetical protein
VHSIKSRLEEKGTCNTFFNTVHIYCLYRQKGVYSIFLQALNIREGKGSNENLRFSGKKKVFVWKVVWKIVRKKMGSTRNLRLDGRSQNMLRSSI